MLSTKTPETGEISAFYDETLAQRLRDYIEGNKRISAAVDLAISRIDHSITRVLDVGCGLGIAAALMADTREWVRVHAVDISPRVIDAARRLYGGKERLVFDVSEMHEVPRLAPYDLITLLDVYEHIPREIRPQLNALLGRSLSPVGTIVLTIPSWLHQRNLARDNPAGLQIVDEVVELDDLVTLAKEVSGELVYFSYVSIWNSNDYVHVVIRRGPSYEPLAWRCPERILDRIRAKIVLSVARIRQQAASARRRRLVTDRLGISLGKTT